MKQPKYFHGILFLGLLSCTAENNRHVAKPIVKSETSAHTLKPAIVQEQKDNAFAFLDIYLQKPAPLTDSTNFDNYSELKFLSENECKMLSLEKVVKKGGDQISVNYRLILSENFKTVVVTYHLGEELWTCLVNYDNNWKLKGSQEIAYDEIAEGWIRAESRVTRNEIIVKRTSWVNEPPEIEVRKYRIEADGKIFKQ